MANARPTGTPRWTNCTLHATEIAIVATSERSTPRPSTTISMPKPSMPSTATLRSNDKMLAAARKFGSVDANPMNSKSVRPNTIFSWLSCPTNRVAVMVSCLCVDNRCKQQRRDHAMDQCAGKGVNLVCAGEAGDLFFVKPGFLPTGRPQGQKGHRAAGAAPVLPMGYWARRNGASALRGGSATMAVKRGQAGAAACRQDPKTPSQRYQAAGTSNVVSILLANWARARAAGQPGVCSSSRWRRITASRTDGSDGMSPMWIRRIWWPDSVLMKRSSTCCNWPGMARPSPGRVAWLLTMRTRWRFCCMASTLMAAWASVSEVGSGVATISTSQASDTENSTRSEIPAPVSSSSRSERGVSASITLRNWLRPSGVRREYSAMPEPASSASNPPGVVITASSSLALPVKTSCNVVLGCRFSITSRLARPRSASSTSTRWPVRARAAARLAETKVLPTPPLPLVTAMMRAPAEPAGTTAARPARGAGAAGGGGGGGGTGAAGGGGGAGAAGGRGGAALIV